MIRLGVLIAALQVASPVTDLLVDDIGRPCARVLVRIELPATRFEIGYESRRLSEIDGDPPLEFRVPAGRYRVEGSCRFQMCGSGSPLPDLATGLQETVVCRERTVVEVPHLLEDGVSIRLQINVEGAPDHAKPFLSLMPGQFRNVEWSDPCHDPLDQWYATATLEPILEGVARGTAVAREIRWGTYRQSVADSHQRVPLGMSAFTTSVYRPGRYRMRLAGPLIEPATAEIVIEPADLTGDGLIACGRTRLTVRAKR